MKLGVTPCIILGKIMNFIVFGTSYIKPRSKLLTLSKNTWPTKYGDDRHASSSFKNTLQKFRSKLLHLWNKNSIEIETFAKMRMEDKMQYDKV